MNEVELFTKTEIGDLVDQFYAKVRRDPEIGPVFDIAVHNWDAHLAMLKDFWSTVLLGTGRYKGNPMLAHFDLEIDRRHFTRWLALYSETAIEVFTAAKAEFVTRKAERIAVNMQRVRADRL
jgi:hemoglobin